MTQNFDANALRRDSAASQHRRIAESPEPQFNRVPATLHAFNPLHRELSVSRAKLAEAAAERARLLATIAILGHKVQKIQRVAYHDELTGLPNRRMLEDRYGLAVARSNRGGENVAILFIDIDRFKHCNDTFGHGVADRLLQQLAMRLAHCIRASDTACRFGGDEFVVLLSDCKGSADAAATVVKIQERTDHRLAV